MPRVWLRVRNPRNGTTFFHGSFVRHGETVSPASAAAFATTETNGASMGWHHVSRVFRLLGSTTTRRVSLTECWRVRSNESTIVASPAVALPVRALHSRDLADSNGQQNTETSSLAVASSPKKRNNR